MSLDNCKKRSTLQGERSTRRRRGSTGRLAATTYAATLLGLLSGPVVARTLGPDGRGEYAAVMTYSGVALVVLSLGLAPSVTHSLLVLNLSRDIIFGNVVKFAAILLVPSVLLGLVAFLALSELSSPAQLAVLVFISLAPLSIIQGCLTSFFLADGLLGCLSASRFIPLVFNFACLIALWITNHLTIGSYLAATLCANLLGTAYVVRTVRSRPRAGGRLSKQLAFALRGYPGSISTVANARLDQLLLVPLAGTAELGVYAVAVSVSVLPLGIAQALSARSVSRISNEDGTLDASSVASNIRVAIVLVGLPSLGVAAISPIAFPLIYGEAFSAAATLCIVLLIGTIAVCISTIAGPAIVLSARMGTESIGQVASLGVTVVGLFVLVPLIGVLGAAATTAVAYWSLTIIQLRILRAQGVLDVIPRRGDFGQAWQATGAAVVSRLSKSQKPA